MTLSCIYLAAKSARNILGATLRSSLWLTSATFSMGVSGIRAAIE